MPIMMTALVHGQTRDGYRQMIHAVESSYRNAPGFILHTSHPVVRGWCVVDVWATKADFERFFAHHIVPKLPPTLRPKIRLQELHDALTVFGGLTCRDGLATVDSVALFDNITPSDRAPAAWPSGEDEDEGGGEGRRASSEC